MKINFRVFGVVIVLLTCINVSNAQWVQQQSGIDATISDVVMLDSYKAIAVARNGSILRTTNSGKTWLDVTAPISYIVPWNSVSFFDTTNGIAVGDHGVVFLTQNGGKSWIRRQTPGGQKCLSALYVGPGNIYVGADSGWIYHSLDSGTTWSAEKISSRPIRSLFAWRGAFIEGLPIYALTPNSLCTKKEFPSFPWKETILNSFLGLGSEAYCGEFCNGGGAGFIVGVHGDLRASPAIIRISISDSTWRQVSNGILGDGVLYGVSAPTVNTIYVCGSVRTAGYIPWSMIFKSIDSGNTWIANITPTSRNLSAIYFYDEKRGFAVGDSGTILFTSNGGMTGVNDQIKIIPTQFELDQNYPNPFNPLTTIRFDLPFKSFVSLKIFDGLGRELETLVSEELPAGTHLRQWKAIGKSGGVYFYRLQSKTFCQTKKLVLLK